jgi:hypothetical protein
VSCLQFPQRFFPRSVRYFLPFLGGGAGFAEDAATGPRRLLAAGGAKDCRGGATFRGGVGRLGGFGNETGGCEDGGLITADVEGRMAGALPFDGTTFVFAGTSPFGRVVFGNGVFGVVGKLVPGLVIPAGPFGAGGGFGLLRGIADEPVDGSIFGVPRLAPGFVFPIAVAFGAGGAT